MSRIDRINKRVKLAPIHERLTNLFETTMVQEDFTAAIGIAAAGLIVEQESGDQMMQSVWIDRRERAKRSERLPNPELVTIEPEAD